MYTYIQPFLCLSQLFLIKVSLEIEKRNMKRLSTAIFGERKQNNK